MRFRVKFDGLILQENHRCDIVSISMEQVRRTMKSLVSSNETTGYKCQARDLRLYISVVECMPPLPSMHEVLGSTPSITNACKGDGRTVYSVESLLASLAWGPVVKSSEPMSKAGHDAICL